jgi:mono/diheme cytochrome c family protein
MSRPSSLVPRLALVAVAALAWYASARAAPAADSAVAASPGDPGRGEALYVGTVRFENGGAPCLACHGVAGHGLARAASFGPDLTAAHATYGDDGLEAMLADVPFPSMQPLYNAHAITAVERRDLGAFLAVAASREPPRLGPKFFLGVVAAAAGFLVLFAALGRRRAAGRPSTSSSHGA